MAINITGLGNANGIGFKSRVSGGGSGYLPPELKDSIVGLWKFDQNTNESPTRNIIKNTIKDKGGDLELLNFGYKLNSGYGKYEVDFTSWSRLIGVKAFSNKFVIENKAFNCAYYVRDKGEDLDEFKAKIANHTDGIIRYTYINQDGIVANLDISPDDSNRVFTFPKSYNSIEGVANHICGFQTPMFVNTGIIIEQIPSHQGALVTDGKDDLITSTKTVKEMLGGSNEVTVVSMVHQIGLSSLTTINNIRSESVAHVVCRNICSSAGKTGIYGYSKQINTNNPPALINNILGDKKDYTAEGKSALDPTDKFFVQGYKYKDSLHELSEVAVYWTFIANKVLTTDEINQIIAYFKLDKYVTPQVIYDVRRQGLTNDTPAADWYLKDFSGNGHDMQLYNYAKTLESGINEEGGLQSDGVNDYGKAEGLPIFKDYTVAIDRAWTNDLVKTQCLTSKLNGDSFGSFSFELIENGFSSYSFGISNKGVITIDSNKKISYQSKYVYNGSPIISGNNVDGKDLFLFRSRDSYPYYAEAAIWSYILFPYSLSEFLLERQLKRYKLGTLYPDIVEFRPVVKSNAEYSNILAFIDNEVLVAGNYYPSNSLVTINVYTKEAIDEVTSLKVNGVDFSYDSSAGTRHSFKGYITKSPQKIDITIDEYIRFEDINLTACYPFIPILEGYTWGDKLKVGTEVKYAGFTNLLPNIYLRRGEMQLNGVNIGNNTLITVSKSMIFSINKAWLLDTTEPHAIYSPQKLNIPNSSLKILGYVPDLTGKGNNGKLNNFAYIEDSGVAADGSIKFDGTDDHITIPTLAHGGKCVMMKVNWSNNGMLYDQRPSGGHNTFGIYTGENHPAYSARNNGSTYIDGILNTNIIPSNLAGITHNITAVNDTATDNSTTYPRLGTSFTNATFSDMSLYEFMLFPEIPSEDEIKKLNDVMGIEGGYIESPNYYWDSFGKKNTDTDRNLIADQVSKDVANALEVKNVAYNSESGYTDNNGLLLDGVEDHVVNTVIPAVTDFTVIAKREFLNNTLQNNETFCLKGDKLYPSGVGNAFVMEYYYGISNYFLSFGGSTDLPLETSKISYITPTSYNGNNAIRGNGDDNAGLMIGKYGGIYWKGVFYKLMFYTKTIDQLSINMLKNLFERDELIDVTNPIFKKQ